VIGAVGALRDPGAPRRAVRRRVVRRRAVRRRVVRRRVVRRRAPASTPRPAGAGERLAV